MSFPEFWTLYPKKCEKIYAQRCYDAAIKNGATHEEILEGVKNYAKHCKSENTERQFIKNPSTWLNKGCWADEYEIPQEVASDPLESRWKARINGFYTNGYWCEEWGRKPNENGCMAPKHLLKSNVVELKRIAT